MRSLNRVMLEWIATEWCGNRVSVPGDNLSTTLESDLLGCVKVGNDAFVLWLGRPDEWAGFMNRRDAHKLAWFILFRWWCVAEWFGLRRWLYYKALHRVVAEWKQEPTTDA